MLRPSTRSRRLAQSFKGCMKRSVTPSTQSVITQLTSVVFLASFDTGFTFGLINSCTLCPRCIITCSFPSVLTTWPKNFWILPHLFWQALACANHPRAPSRIRIRCIPTCWTGNGPMNGPGTYGVTRLTLFELMAACMYSSTQACMISS